jgi:hypothetical protein
MSILIINTNNHPNTNLPTLHQKRRTMNPTIAALIIKLGHPLDARRDTPPGHFGVQDFIAFGA